jgi:hypothetical protein
MAPSFDCLRSALDLFFRQMRMATAQFRILKNRHLVGMRLYDAISYAIAFFQPPRLIFAPFRAKVHMTAILPIKRF